MARIHDTASVVPSKREMVMGWVRDQPWLGDADTSSLSLAGSYRFDDPDGEVGIETMLLRTADDQLVQVPLTYRASPADGAVLIGTLQHSVLGERFIQDGCTDPVYVAALVTAIVAGGREADQELDDGTLRELTTCVRGSGNADGVVPPLGTPQVANSSTTSVILAGDIEIVVRRVVTDAASDPESAVLAGTWPGHDDPAVLAELREVSPQTPAS